MLIPSVGYLVFTSCHVVPVADGTLFLSVSLFSFNYAAYDNAN